MSPSASKCVQVRSSECFGVRRINGIRFFLCYFVDFPGLGSNTNVWSLLLQESLPIAPCLACACLRLLALLACLLAMASSSSSAMVEVEVKKELSDLVVRNANTSIVDTFA